MKARQVKLSEYYYEQIGTKDFVFEEKELLLDSLLQQQIKIDTVQLVKIYRSFLKELKYSNIEKSFSIIAKVEEITKSSNNYDIEDVKAIHRNKIAFLNRTQKFYKAIHEVNLYLEKYSEKNVQLAKVYRQLGNIYSELGDLQKSIDNFDQSIYIYKELKDNKGLATSLKDKLATYVDLNDSAYTSKIWEVVQEIEALKEVYNVEAKIEKAYKNNMGCFFDFLEDYSQAKASYFEALDISLEEEDFENVFFMYTNLGVVYKKEKNLEKALQYLEKASEYMYDEKYKEAMVSNNLADIYKLQNNHQKALIHYQKAITQALQINTIDYQKLPNFQDIELSPNKLDILGYLIDKANGWIAYYEAEGISMYLQNALDTFTLADQVIDIIYLESREDLSKLFWRKKGASFYPKAVEVCYRLLQPEKAFFFMEKNKAMLLLENMTNATAKRLSKLPENMLEREQSLIKEIKALEAEIQFYTADNRNIDALKDSVFKYKEEYNAFIDSLEINYPKYYNYKKNINLITLQDVQKNLTDDELILQYIVGKEKGFVALISSNGIQLEALPQTTELVKVVTAYKHAISEPFVNTNDKENYQKIAQKLYQQLVPFSNNNIRAYKRITVVADAMLQYIPYEALVTPAHDYLIQNAEIHYNYSLSSAAQSKQNKTPIAKTFIAIAPTKFKSDTYKELATSSTELKKLTGIFEANHFQYEKATKERFTTAYGNYKIIHLSTHGGVDNTIPWMTFYDEKMTLDELYFTKNQSDLVVLSACKTSDGELKKGEGVMSLARGFFNAGAKSVVSSLWDINEKASNEIIQEFYKNIVAGNTKSEALQKAKLTYIKNNENTSEASPYYWSALTLTGDIAPVHIVANQYLYYIFGAVLLSAMILFSRRKRIIKEAA